MFSLPRAAIALSALLSLLVPSVADAHKGGRDNRGHEVTVMTRNIYLGGDITRPLTATAGLSGLPALLAFGQANHTLRGIVDQTNFPARAKLLAREIKRTKPDLIGLQEVAKWSHGPLELGAIGTANATTVDYDFLAILLDELSAAGQRYDAVSIQEESDVEGPAFAGSPADGTGRDVRLTMRDVILRRQRSGVKITAKGSGQYATRIPFSIGGVTYQFIRGYNWADVKARGRSFRFVNTHLESQLSTIALLQAQELVQGVAAPGSKPTILVCDCNSDPLNGSIKPQEPIPTPHWAAYRLLTSPGLYKDAWLSIPGAGPGFTSGLSEFVNDPDTSSIDHRIDLVLSRKANGTGLKASNGRIVGTDPENRTATGLWPSDHAGVVVDLDLR